MYFRLLYLRYTTVAGKDSNALTFGLIFSYIVSSPMAMQTGPGGKVDRQTTCPFHLKLFYRTGGFHRYVELSKDPLRFESLNARQTRRFPHILDNLSSSPTSANLHLAHMHPPRTLPPPYLCASIPPSLTFNRNSACLSPYIPRHPPSSPRHRRSPSALSE